MSALTAFQTEVARIFFTLPASDGFLLAGGAALLAADLTSRPTDDLDFFGQRHQVDVGAAATQLEHVLGERGWHTTRIQSGPTFVRLHVTGDEPLLVDIAIDAPPARTPVVSMLGPTFDPEELAGRKLAALFGRAEARDFADVFVLAQRYGRSLLLKRALQVDLGLDLKVLAEMMRTIERFVDAEIPVTAAEVQAIRRFFADWAGELDGIVERRATSAGSTKSYRSWDDVPEPFRSKVVAEIDGLAKRFERDD